MSPAEPPSYPYAIAFRWFEHRRSTKFEQKKTGHLDLQNDRQKTLHLVFKLRKTGFTPRAVATQTADRLQAFVLFKRLHHGVGGHDCVVDQLRRYGKRHVVHGVVYIAGGLGNLSPFTFLKMLKPQIAKG